MPSILLVEDDDTIGELVSAALAADGHEVFWERDGGGADHLASGTPVDLVLLDLGLPDVDGLALCRTLRLRQPEAILVMLTARRDEMDVIVGLESGADDYLTKPFRVSELLARVRAHLRRAAHATDQASVYRCGDLVVDLAVRRCLVADREVRLRAKEFDLLSRLAMSAGQALSRDTLMADVWGANWFGSTKTLDVHVAAVRRRLREAASDMTPEPRLPKITTLRGFGYRLEASRQPADSAEVRTI